MVLWTLKGAGVLASSDVRCDKYWYRVVWVDVLLEQLLQCSICAVLKPCKLKLYEEK
jgi:hypothetical protein